MPEIFDTFTSASILYCITFTVTSEQCGDCSAIQVNTRILNEESNFEGMGIDKLSNLGDICMDIQMHLRQIGCGVMVRSWDKKNLWTL